MDDGSDDDDVSSKHVEHPSSSDVVTVDNDRDEFSELHVEIVAEKTEEHKA